MSLRVTLHPNAETELRETAHWYEHGYAGLGLRFLDAVNDVLVRIRRWPDAAATLDLSDTLVVRRVPLRIFPYHVALLMEHDTIHVLATAHDHRRLDYWRDRTE